MQLITEIKRPQAVPNIHFDHKIATLGSCFSEHIGQQFARYYWDSLVQPFGTYFNPISLLRLLESVALNKTPDSSRYTEYDEVYYHYDYPHTLYGRSPTELQHTIDSKAKACHDFLQSADFLVITLGTATVYTLNTTVVANCHKQAQQHFEKTTLPYEHIQQSLNSIVHLLETYYPQIQCIWTISPVRHIRDGLELNQLNKSMMRAAVHSICNLDKHWYFPSYEIVIDSLRDYRFYDADLIHPNSMAIHYIWDKLAEWCFDIETKNYINSARKIHLAKQHRVQNVYSNAHLQFVKQTNSYIQSFNESYNRQISLLS